ncbi:PREDICTED: acyl-CoA Delta(11) desaturase-like [Vollenhovia emeryi]|uniref:acyl-CoA Delta(11) desaturase-like n=1 Tax=Vollenhovia emeryi TaxID=411798 RepID=UPI0005F524EC|nr:PREDICTED: acyl-CoA Delta(11) desaturase-like [Vollenhovia emeryi]
MKSMAEKTMMENLLTQKTQNSQSKYKWNIVWRNVISLTYLHIAGFYGLYIAFTDAKFYTFLWNLTVAVFAALGITAGAHRLWAHRCYKAKLPMRVILMILETTAFQNHIYEWVRDHRVHHKFVDTDADPYNAKRGFFFSHVGWLMVRKHPDVISKGATVDMSDLDKDPVVTWQRKYYSVLMPLFCFVLPMWVSIYFWDEKPIYAWYIVVAKYIFQVNITWSINSAAHYWGTKPFDK